MGEILSHAEVEAILSAINPSRLPQSMAPPANAAVSDAPAWERHDFRRREPLRGAALQIIHALHTGFGQQSKARLETLLSARVEIHPVGACQTTAAEFFGSLKPPCTVCQLGQPNSEPNFFLVWSTPLPQILFAKMLGGQDQRSGDAATHAITRIEHRLLSKLNELMLQELANLLQTQLIIANVHEDNSSLPKSALTSPTIWLSFEMDCGGARGVIHIGLPRFAINAQPSSITTDPVGVDANSNSVADSLPSGIQKVTVEVSANLARLGMRISDVATLQIGDILMTDLAPTEPITLRLGDQTLCQAAMGTHAGQKALRLIQRPRYCHPKASD